MSSFELSKTERVGNAGRTVRWSSNDLEVLMPDADFPSFDGRPPLKMAWFRVERNGT